MMRVLLLLAETGVVAHEESKGSLGFPRASLANCQAPPVPNRSSKPWLFENELLKELVWLDYRFPARVLFCYFDQM